MFRLCEWQASPNPGLKGGRHSGKQLRSWVLGVTSLTHSGTGQTLINCWLFELSLEKAAGFHQCSLWYSDSSAGWASSPGHVGSKPQATRKVLASQLILPQARVACSQSPARSAREQADYLAGTHDASGGTACCGTAGLRTLTSPNLCTARRMLPRDFSLLPS